MPERPRYEPEILPPDPRGDAGFRRFPHDFGAEEPFGFDPRAATNDNRRPRLLVWQVGPIRIALILLGIGLVTGMVLALILGALLVAAPLAALALLGFIGYVKLRRFWSRLSRPGGSITLR